MKIAHYVTLFLFYFIFEKLFFIRLIHLYTLYLVDTLVLCRYLYFVNNLNIDKKHNLLKVTHSDPWRLIINKEVYQLLI